MNHSFNVEIAKKFRIEKAVILEHFYFWIKKNKANKKNLHEGRYYTYNTAEAFAELFPYIKERRIAQLLREMENEDNLLLSGQFFNYDRTKSYTLTDFALSFFEPSNIQNFDNGTYKNLTIEDAKNGDCLNTDINTDIKPNINTDNECVSYIQKQIDITKQDFKKMKEEVYNSFVEHNEKNAVHKIPVPSNIDYFDQKFGGYIVELTRQYKADDILSALKNYLKVANCQTWKSGFSVKDFCRNICEYIPEFFDISKYIDTPKSEEEIKTMTQSFADENLMKDWFNYAIFHHNRKKWIQAGQPEGEDFKKWANDCLCEDVKNGRANPDGDYI